MQKNNTASHRHEAFPQQNGKNNEKLSSVRCCYPRGCLGKISHESFWPGGCLSEDCKTLLCGKVILVQKIGWILAILCAVSWFASEIRLPGDDQTVPAQEETAWRRTADGWEKATDWTVAIEKSPPALHPGVLGLLMVALSLTVGTVKTGKVE
jgi:hypothetical protein